MTNPASDLLATLRTANEWDAPAPASDAAGPPPCHREARDTDPASEQRPRGEWSRAMALQIRRGVDDCSDALLALAMQLRLIPSGQTPPGTREQSLTVARLAESSVIACAVQLQKSAALLDEEIRLVNRLELELLEARRELQQARQQLLESQVHEERARHKAFHDTLTGLPNRVSFEERSSRALAQHRPLAQEFGLMYLDLDGFKSINDAHGHAVGDELLKVIGSRLTHAVRTRDSISRQGGDEFLCLLLDVQSEQQVASIARKLIDTVSAPCQIGFLTLCVRPSIGIALYPRDGSTVEALLESADKAMFWAKRHRLGHALFRHVPSRQDSCSRSGQDLAASPAIKQLSLPGAGDRIPS